MLSMVDRMSRSTPTTSTALFLISTDEIGRHLIPPCVLVLWAATFAYFYESTIIPLETGITAEEFYCPISNA